jgi:hypothetical protein
MAEAVIATSPRATVPDGLPAAVWVEHEDELSCPLATDQDTTVLATRADLLEAAGPRGLLVPARDPIADAAFVSPFVRERLQRARGLPPAPVLEQREGAWWWPGRDDPLPDALLPTALACAAAASVESPDAVVAALAFGTPVICEEEAAGSVGAIPGEQVLTGDSHASRRRLAGDVATDSSTASRLSWEGRRHYEQCHDMSRAAILLILRLLAPGRTAAGALVGVQLLLGYLNTPPTAMVRSRVAAAVATLPDLVEGRGP